MHPDELDPAAVCGQISRDHGLIFLDENARIFFRDFGTKKEGERKGSKNGTWVNGVPEDPGTSLSRGTRATTSASAAARGCAATASS